MSDDLHLPTVLAISSRARKSAEKARQFGDFMGAKRLGDFAADIESIAMSTPAQLAMEAVRQINNDQPTQQSTAH